VAGKDGGSSQCVLTESKIHHTLLQQYQPAIDLWPKLEPEFFRNLRCRDQAGFGSVFIEPTTVIGFIGNPIHDLTRIVEKKDVAIEDEKSLLWAEEGNVENLASKRVFPAVLGAQGKRFQSSSHSSIGSRSFDELRGREHPRKHRARFRGEGSVVVDSEFPSLFRKVKKGQPNILETLKHKILE
jgi:hypothetical protein